MFHIAFIIQQISLDYKQRAITIDSFIQSWHLIVLTHLINLATGNQIYMHICLIITNTFAKKRI